MVYIHQSSDSIIQGFYLWGYSASLHRHMLLQYKDPPVGYIEVQFTVVNNIILQRKIMMSTISKVFMNTTAKTD